MGYKIFASLATLLLFSRISHQVTPEERCELSGTGSVCLDCFRTGICVANGDGTYSVEFNYNCPDLPSISFCDDTFSDPQYFGACSPLPPSYTNCSCSSSTQCIADVNNPAVVLHCESSPPVTDPPCPNSMIDLNTCSCASCSDSCPLLDDPNDDCASYFYCSGTDFIQATCSGDLCFDQESCGCVERRGSSSSFITSTAITAVTPLMCPESCPFVDDPYDDCSSFFFCGGTYFVQANCSDDFCFDQASCQCVERRGSSSSFTTSTAITAVTPLTCPAGCPFVDDPYDDCSSYFICSGDSLIPVTCSSYLCFDQERCACVEREATTTKIPTTSTLSPSCPLIDDPDDDCSKYFSYDGINLILHICPEGSCFNATACGCVTLTCPTGCPFVDDPNDSCESYFVCNGDHLTHVYCTDTLCFDQESCGCVARGETTTAPPTPTPTFSPNCPYLDDPNDDCASFFLLDGNNLISFNCVDGSCFNQTSCGCVDAPLTCPAGCPLVDDPNDNCGSYFVCSGSDLIPVNCTDTLCFDQASCGCVVNKGTTTKLLTTTEPLPTYCPYLDDPNDDCSSFFVFDGTKLIPANCDGTSCFDPEACACVETLPTCSEECPFVDDPYDDCRAYFVCSGNEIIPINCPDTLCFDQASCGCVERVGSPSSLRAPTARKATAKTTTPLTCPSDCPFVDDPSSCERFYYCDGTNLIPEVCPGTLCFDQPTCTCR